MNPPDVSVFSVAGQVRHVVRSVANSRSAMSVRSVVNLGLRCRWFRWSVEGQPALREDRNAQASRAVGREERFLSNACDRFLGRTIERVEQIQRSHARPAGPPELSQ